MSWLGGNSNRRLQRRSAPGGQGTVAPVGRVAGVTLIELMVVIVLVSLLAAAIVPQFRGTFDDAILKGTTREIVNTLHLAYSQAVTLNRSHRVQFDLMEGYYWIEGLVESETGEQQFMPATGVSVSARAGSDRGVIDERIALELSQEPGTQPAGRSERRDSEQPTERITFRPDGTADGQRLVLRDRGGFGFEILIHPTTSRVRVRALEREERP